MRFSPHIAFGLFVLTALPALSGEPGTDLRFQVGQSLRLCVAKEYSAPDLDIAPDRLATRGTLTRHDQVSVTLSTIGTNETVRYAAGGAHLSGVVAALGADWLSIDIGDDQPPVRVPLQAIAKYSPGAAIREPLPGELVRVVATEPTSMPITGRLVAMNAEAMLVRVDDRSEAISLQRSSVASLSVRRSGRYGAGKGALIGSCAVGVPLAIIGVLTGERTRDWGDARGREDLRLGYGLTGLVVGGAAGAAVGAIVGHTTHRSPWVTVAPVLETRSGAGSSRGHGVRAALTLRY
jgi:hypothetical protein